MEEENEETGKEVGQKKWRVGMKRRKSNRKGST
jgi:hypothetical protein